MNTPRRSLDDTLRAATDELHHDLDASALDPFTPNRRRTPVVAAVAVLILGAGTVGLLLTNRSDQAVVQSPIDTTDTAIEPPSSSNVVTLDPTPTVGPGPVVGPITDFANRVPDVLDQPRQGDELIDPSFGQTIRRITNSAADEYIAPLASMTSAWNADESKLLLYRTTAAREGRHELYDVATASFIAEVPIAPSDIEQVAWSRTDPDVLVYVEGSSLKSIDVATMDVTTEHTFDDCEVLTPSVGGSGMSADGDVIALWCDAVDGAAILSYRFSTQEIVQVATEGTEAPLVAPSGTRFLLPLPDAPAVVLDARLLPTGVLVDAFATLANDADGNDIAVGPSFGGDRVGSIVATDLATGVATVIVGPDTGAPFPPGGNTVSASGVVVAFSTRNLDGFDARSLDDPDFVANWAALDGEVVLVDFGESEPTVIRLAHNRTSELIGFWSSTFVSVSPSGERVAFSSDWASDSSVDTYVIDVAR